jgi:nicotinate-nucleotide pyrophosphorylase (carboxylating)
MGARRSVRAHLASTVGLVRQALKEDIGSGDVTTRSVIPSGRLGLGTIRAKEPLILAGLPLAREVFRQVDPALRFEPLRGEGSRVERGARVARIHGRAASILTAERTALNFLQHLSGIATYTARCVDEARSRCRVRDTRKTHPGLREVEKYAVRLAGGENHRFRLDDGILIKHNHWRVAGGVRVAVERARRLKRRNSSLPIQVEVSTLSDLREALEAGADSVLLDNLAARQIRQAVNLIRGRIPVELSGGITRRSISRFASYGVDSVSLGALTHSARWVDLSLRLEVAER